MIANKIISSSGIPDLPDVQNKVYNFIILHPKCSKEAVVKYCNDNQLSARKTTFNIIDRLLELGLINDLPNEKNRQTRSLVINEKNILVIVVEELNEFKQTFFHVLEQIKRKINEDSPYPPLIDYVVEFYKEVLDIYVLKCMLKWSTELNDKTLLNMLYRTVVSNIIEIQLKFSDFLNHVFYFQSDRNVDKWTNEITFFNSKLVLPPNYEPIHKFFKSYGLGKEVEPLLKSLYKVKVNHLWTPFGL